MNRHTGRGSARGHRSGRGATSASLVAVMLLGLLATAVPASAQPGPQTLVVTSSLEPAPVTPGTQALLLLDLRNAGNQTVTSIYVRIDNVPDGLRIDGLQHFLGGLGGGDRSTYALTVTVDPETPVGRYLLPMQIDYCLFGGSCGNGLTHTAAIVVQDGQQLHLAGVSPANLARVGATDLHLRLENPLATAVRDVVVTWSVADASVLPLGRDNRLQQESIPAGGSADLSTPVLVAPGAAAGIRSMDLTVTYRDAAGTVDSFSTSVGLLIGGPTDFDAGDATLLDGILTLTLANIGQEQADSVVVRALDGDGRALGVSFLGTLEPGDYATVPMRLDEGTTRVDMLSIESTDVMGVRTTEQFPLGIEEKPPEVMDEGNGELLGLPYLAWGIGGVVVAIGAFTWWRRRGDRP